MFSPAITAGVNFTMVPCAGGGGSACELSDVIEACALDATGCLGGCSGEAAAKLGSFVGCFEHNFNESHTPVCVPADVDKCTAQAGIKDEHDRCMQSPGRRASAASYIAAQTKAANPRFFPTVLVAGKHANPQNSTTLKSVLCDAGVKAAC